MGEYRAGGASEHALILGIAVSEVCDRAGIRNGSSRNETAVAEYKKGQMGSGPYRNVKGHAQQVLLERLHRRRLIVLHIENGVQLGDLQQVVDFLGQLEQLQFATLVLGGGKGADQFADA